MLRTLFLSLSLIFLSAPAWAADALGDQWELRVGVTEHDIQFLGLGESKEKENSGALNLELIAPEPDFLKPFLSPQPFIGGTINLGGRTSYGGAGMLFRQYAGERLYGEWATGVVVHDGTLENDPSDLILAFRADPTIVDDFSDAQVIQFLTDVQDLEFRENNNIEFGSRVLFRNAFTVGYRLNRKLAVEVFLEHLSHGEILSSGSNEGLESWGLRTALRF